MVGFEWFRWIAANLLDYFDCLAFETLNHFDAIISILGDICRWQEKRLFLHQFETERDLLLGHFHCKRMYGNCY